MDTLERELPQAKAELAAQREQVAQWMLANGFATGHGDTIAGLLQELTWQVATLRAECERLKVDAERYRYLRTHSYVERMEVKDGIGIIHVGVGFQQTRPEFLDADIDEAMRLDSARKAKP